MSVVFSKISEILKLMRTPSKIRNVGTLAHVDHGKTTLTDVILAHGGMISKELAGKVRYLDFLDEEQRRGITMKTAAISILMPLNKDAYLLNLVDTPGHIDFSGKVSRALRIIDGAIVVVDAVEGVMAQTEAYLKLALSEWVKPILLVNKVDRLIRELSMNETQIINRLEEIVVDFNNIIEAYSEPDQKNWKVDPKKEDVIFGSALYGWGFTLVSALKKGLKIKKIIELEQQGTIKKVLPLGPLIARIIYEKLPDPQIAQHYRIEKLWTTETIPKNLIECSKTEPTILYISKIQLQVGKIFSTTRIFSGNVRKGSFICLNTGKSKNVDSIQMLFGSKTKTITEAPAGNIVGVMLDARPGETYSTENVPGHFKIPTYIAVPVVFVALEPKKLGSFDRLLKELRVLTLEDPNLIVEISKETGQILLGGIGEFHLETALNRLKEKIDFYSSEPMVAYKEVIIEGSRVESEEYIIEIHPIDFEKVDIKELFYGKLTNSVDGNIISFQGFEGEEKKELKETISEKLKFGPILGESIFGCRVLISKKNKKKEINVNRLLTSFVEALVRAKFEIYEPYYEFNLSTKPEYIGDVTAELNRREARIKKMETYTGDMVKLRGIIPVRTSIGLPSVIRSVTHGRAFIQLEFYGYSAIPERSKEQVIKSIKEAKGLI